MPSWIDLRKENRGLIRGDTRTVPQGFWAVMRQYRHTEMSQYWDDSWKESLKGGKYKYDDVILRLIIRPKGSISRSVIFSTPVLDTMGKDDASTHIVAIEYCKELIRPPMIGDVIFEIKEHASVDAPTAPLHATSRHDMVAVTPELGDYGQAEIYYSHTIKQSGKA